MLIAAGPASVEHVPQLAPHASPAHSGRDPRATNGHSAQASSHMPFLTSSPFVPFGKNLQSCDMSCAVRYWLLHCLSTSQYHSLQIVYSKCSFGNCKTLVFWMVRTI